MVDSELYNFTCNVVYGIAMAGIVVSLLNVKKAIFLGLGIAWLAMNVLFVLSLAGLKAVMGNWYAFMYAVVSTSGTILMSLLILGFYVLFCVLKNRDYISDNNMPDSWYTFSYFIIIITAMDISAIVMYLKSKDTFYSTLSLLCGTIMFGFVVIETIICSYFRTDGFTI